MKRKTLMVLSSIAAIIGGSVFFLSNRTPLVSKASETNYQSLSSIISKQNPPFIDINCIATADKSSIREAYILRELHKTSPKGVPYRDLLVAIKYYADYDTFYALQAIDYRKGECSSYYTTVGDEEESNPLGRHFSAQKALEIQLIWDKWRLGNIPDWKNKMQKRLNRPKVQLAKEEFLSLKQLGFKMPKKWEEVK
jgi:hypothetical protein